MERSTTTAIAAAHGTLGAELSLAVQFRRPGSGHGGYAQRRLHIASDYSLFSPEQGLMERMKHKKYKVH